MIDIFRKVEGVETLVVSLPDTNATLERGIMGADEVSLNVTESEILDLRVGDYARFDGVEYSINREPDLVKASAVEYRYDVVLESPLYNLLDKIYMQKMTEKSRFSLAGTLTDFVDLLLKNINQEDFDAGWSKAVDEHGKELIVETEVKTLSFDNTTCRDVLTKLAEEFDTEYVVRGRTIAFHERLEVARDIVFEQGQGKGLYTLQRQNVDADNTVTRAYVFGSTENLPAGYREGQYSRLCPRELGTDDYIPCFENRAEYPKLVEREVYFDDVKPSFTGSVDSVSADFLQVRCDAIDFNLKDVLVGKEGRVNFLTGDLMGIAFSFTYDHPSRTLKLIPQEDDRAEAGSDGKRPQLPNKTWHAKGGDKFTFTGINLPDSYVRHAESLLAEKGRKWTRVHSSLRVKYNLDVDYRYARETGIELSPGDVVGIVVPGQEGTQKLRVTNVKKQLSTGKLTCEVSNYLQQSLEDSLNAKIQDVRSSIELDRSELLYNINATREWTTRNFGRLAETMEDGEAIVWDADNWEIKTEKQVPDAVLWDTHKFADYLNQAIRTDSDVRFKSVSSAEFASGLTGFGYKISEKGVGELASLKLREFLEVPELRFNRVDVVSGELWNAVAFGLIESVDTENRIVTLKLEDGEMSGIRVNDICRGLFHHIEGNADGTIIDSCGFSTLPGFSTSYFTPVALFDNGKRFKYELKPGTTVHPCTSMKYVVYGNFTDRNRRASAYSTKTYKRYLKGVRTWETGAENIAMQFGDLSDLNINGVDMSGYSAYLNNVYFTGTLQWTPEQLEQVKGQDGYGVTLTTYEMAVGVDSEGNINQVLYDVENVATGSKLVQSADRQVVNTRYKIQTVIQAYKGQKKLNFSETPGTGEYSVTFTSRGCNFIFNNDIITVTAITADTAFIEMEVNCEGNVVFEKRFTVTKVYDGKDGIAGNWISHVFKKSDTRPDTPVGTKPVPDGWEDAPGGDGRWWMSKATVNGATGDAGEWSGPVQVTAEDGVDGAYTDFKFRKNSSVMEAPAIDRNARVPDGWSDEPPVLSPGEYLWMAKVEVDAYNKLKGTWSIPTRISGEKGEKGDDGPQGVPGKKGEDGKVTYTWIRYADSVSGGGISNNPTGKTYIGFAYNKDSAMESNIPGDYTWSKIKGEKGDTGVVGPKGENGVTTYTWIKYSDNANGSGMYDLPRESTQYIGIAVNKNTETESNIPGDYTWSKFRGDEGNGIKSVTNYYLATASASGVTTSTSGWTTTVQSVTASKKYLWNYEVVTYTSGTPVSTVPCVIGTYGDTGATGNGISSIKEHYAVSTSNTTAPTSWSDSVPTLTATNKYLWNYETINYTSGKSVDTTKRVIGVYGDKGDPGITGGKGDPGLQGCICRMSEWATGVEYRNDESLASGTRYLDIAVVTKANGTFDAYQCKKTHTSSTSIGVTNTTYWQKFSSLPPVYTPLIMAKNSVIRFMQGNQLLVQKADGTITAGLSGNGSGKDGIRIWAGASNPVDARFQVDEDGRVKCRDGVFSGEINATSGVFNGSIQTTLKKIEESDAIECGISSYDLVNDLQVDASGNLVVYLPTSPSYAGRRCIIVSTARGISRVPVSTTLRSFDGSRILGVKLTQAQIDADKYCNKIVFFGGYVELLGISSDDPYLVGKCHWMVIGASGTMLDIYTT